MRQLQTKKSDYIAYAEWNGDGPTGPIPPDDSFCFVDVTDTPDAQLGGTYNPADDSWSAPPAPVVVLKTRKQDLIAALTPAEYVAMLGPQTDPMLAWSAAMFAAASDPFTLSDPRVGTTLAYCVSNGLLTQVRADAIAAALLAASAPG